MLCIATACSSLAWADTKNVSAEGLSEDITSDWGTNYTTNATSGTAPLTFNTNISGRSVTYSGTIRDGKNANVSLTINMKGNYSYLNITQPQAYTGPTKINGVNGAMGWIQLLDKGTLGTGDITLDETINLVFSGSGYKDFTQNVNGGSIFLYTASDMTISGNMTNIEEINCGSSDTTNNATYTLSGENSINLGLNVCSGNTIISGKTTADFVTIENGKIVVSGKGSLNFSGSVRGSGKDVATLEFNGPSEFSLGAKGCSVIYSGDDAMTISGAIGDTSSSEIGSLSVTGSGTLTVSAANSYTGGTTISNGKLILTDDGTLGSGDTIVNGGTLEFENTQTATIKTLSGNSGLDVGTSTVTITDTVTQTGGDVTISGGTLNVAGGTLNNLSGTGTLNTSADLTVNVDSDTTKKFTGTISASGQEITKSGNGTLQLNGENSGDITATTFTLGSGRLDMKGFYTGQLDLADGEFSPGNSTGTLDVTGTTSITGTAVKMLFEINSLTDHDYLKTTSFNAGAYKNFLDLAVTGSYNKDDKVALIEAGSFSDGYKDWLSTSVTDWELFMNGSTLYAKYKGSGSETGVPEPSTWALLILGCAGLMWYRRKK